MYTAAVPSIVRINAKPSGGDLADLSKNRPRWKYRNRYRPGMNFRVTSDFLRIVRFSIFDRLNDAFLVVFRDLVVLGEITQLEVSDRKIT